MNGARWRRRLTVVIGVLVVLVSLAWLAGEAYKTRDSLPQFLARAGPVTSAAETIVEDADAYSVTRVALQSALGIHVDALLKAPRRKPGPHPVLMILGGAGTGSRTVEYLGDTGNWLVMALDYPYRGRKSGLSRSDFLAALPEMRRAALDTVPAGMLAVDYLLRRGDVDSDRIVLAGGSLGALFAPALGAADERVSAVAILFGAGDLGAVIEANVDLSWPFRPIVSWIGSVIVSPLEPLKYVGRISPRPVFMLNGTEDAAMPGRCSRALHEAAREPKTVCWLDLGHVTVHSAEFHEQVVEQFLAWLRDIGFLSPDEELELLPR